MLEAATVGQCDLRCGLQPTWTSMTASETHLLPSTLFSIARVLGPEQSASGEARPCTRSLDPRPNPGLGPEIHY